MSKVVCVLYDDPVDGYPSTYARDDIPWIDRYPGGQTVPTPKAIDFKLGTLLGSVSGELGLRKYLESRGHEFVVTCRVDVCAYPPWCVHRNSRCAGFHQNSGRLWEAFVMSVTLQS
jgi:hypothetical protein